ncbi:putative reverse transcriptase domain-containing protein [Tanacetum coccineum]
MPPKRNSMSAAAIERLISQCVVDALLDYEANRNSGNETETGTEMEMEMETTIGMEATIQEVEGRLTHWFEKMKSVFHISNCAIECQVKYATYTLLGGALTWWNFHVRTIGHDAAYEMSWKSLMKMMTEAYCPRNEIQKLENELWNLTVKGTDLASYTQRFQELALLCSRMLPEKTDKVERQDLARAYTARPGKKKEYAGTLPLCYKCKYHHTGSCTAKCGNFKRIHHHTKDCRSLAATTNQRTLVANQRTLTCFEYGKQGHYCSECPELKNQNRGNQAGSSEARGRVHALGGGEIDQDPSNIADNADA